MTAQLEALFAKAYPSWAPVDLEAVLAGGVAPLEPTHLIRSDGARLLYPGKVHMLHGEPETLKSLFAQLAVGEVLLAGGAAVYVDHETEARDVVGHLLALGVPEEAILAGLFYIRPDQPLLSSGSRIVPPRSGIAVVDGVDEAMALQGLNPNSAVEFLQWLELEVRPLQQATTGPILTIDHVGKDRESRGDWARGSGAKKGAADVSLGFEIAQHFGRGRVGVARVLLHKDRPGALRGHQGTGKEIARLRLTSHYPADDTITAELLPPAAGEGGETGSRWMPTAYMER